jgi:hypothetical protein
MGDVFPTVYDRLGNIEAWKTLDTENEIQSRHANKLGKYKGKVKIVPVLFFTEYRAMKTYWGSGSIAPRILDLGTRWR